MKFNVYCSNPDIQVLIPEEANYLKRLELLDQDATKMNEVLQCFAEKVPADIYVMMHTTAPFISAASIKKGLDSVSSGQYDSAFAVKNCRIFMERWKTVKLPME